MMASAEEELKIRERARVMMADLSRLRQEELPLSSKETRGPSYAPTRNNEADDIPAADKERWKAQWTVSFDDEEARQCEGLALEDSRPYAKSNVAPPLGSNPNVSSDPGQAPIRFQFPESSRKNRRKKSQAPLPPPSAPLSETGSNASSKPSWTAKRAYAMATQVQSPGPLPKPSSRVSRSIIATANNFLRSIPTNTVALKENRRLPVEKAVPPLEVQKHMAMSVPEVVSSSSEPQQPSALKESTAPVIQPATATLIDIEEETVLNDEYCGQGMDGLGVLEANNLLEIAKESIPAIIEGRIGQLTSNPRTERAVRTILSGLLMLKRSLKQVEAASLGVASTSMAELMELVQNDQPTKLRYNADELLKLRRLGRLRICHEAAVNETTKANKAFYAVLKPNETHRRNDSLGAPPSVAATVGDVLSSKESTPCSSEIAEDSIERLTKRAASLTLSEKPVVRGLASSYWARDHAEATASLFVLPPKSSCAVSIKPECSERERSNCRQVHSRKASVQEVFKALAKLDKDDEELRRSGRQPETPKSGLGPMKVPSAKKGLASSMWA